MEAALGLEGDDASPAHAAHSSSFIDMDDAALFYPVYDDFQSDARKQAAADALSHFSQFAMVCISKGVQPSQLKFHLMKEVSGIPTSLDEEHCSSKGKTVQHVASSSSASVSTPADDIHVVPTDDNMQT